VTDEPTDDASSPTPETPTQTPTETASPTPSDTPTETPSPTPSNTPTSTDTPTATLDFVFQIQTELAMTEAAVTQAAAMTLTASAAYASATAAQWTYTPSHTPTYTLTPTPTDTLTPTIDYKLIKAQTATAYVQTLTATSWTDTPTPTLTPREIAERGVAQNADWQPYSETVNGVEMMLVPVGCFRMGSNDYEDEQPIHEQCFDAPFWIDKTEVTNVQYGSASCATWSSEPNQPRNCISWFDANAYCESRGARLPTEAEWEYAARGPDALVYPWGNSFVGENVVYTENSGNQTADVGSRPAGASWVGAMDMSGNLWEWVSSIYDQELFPYPYQAEDGREDDSNINSSRVLRGGSFPNSVNFLRAANRNGDDPTDGYYKLGCSLCSLLLELSGEVRLADVERGGRRGQTR
jgi:formylglycine-generating enzyme required for sulfatase activity